MKVLCKHTCLGIIAFLCLIATAHAQELQFTAEASNDSILIGNVFSVRFKMENVDGEFKEPEFENMEQVYPPSVSSSFSSINGKVTNSKTYTFVLKPIQEGQFVIHSTSVEHEGKELMTEPLTIFVYPNPENIKQNNSFQEQNDFFFSVPFDMPVLPEPKKKKKAKPKLKRI